MLIVILCNLLLNVVWGLSLLLLLLFVLLLFVCFCLFFVCLFVFYWTEHCVPKENVLFLTFKRTIKCVGFFLIELNIGSLGLHLMKIVKMALPYR